jgi:hypothetical protein
MKCKTFLLFGAMSFFGTFTVGTGLSTLVDSPLKAASDAVHWDSVKTDVSRLNKIKVPLNVSHTGSIQLLDGYVSESSPETATAKFLLKNNSDNAIVAYTVESGNDRDSDACGAFNARNQIAKAGEEFTITVGLSNFRTGMPLRLSAVVFADGTAEGEAEAKTLLINSVTGKETKSERRLILQ